jgi:hypothetical protein
VVRCIRLDIVRRKGTVVRGRLERTGTRVQVAGEGGWEDGRLEREAGEGG